LRDKTKEKSPLHKVFLYCTFPMMEKYEKIKAKRMLPPALRKQRKSSKVVPTLSGNVNTFADFLLFSYSRQREARRFAVPAHFNTLVEMDGLCGITICNFWRVKSYEKEKENICKFFTSRWGCFARACAEN
jgi:hypothetical protein